MSNSTTLLDTIAVNQANKEAIVNAILDALSPASLWGRHASACSGLTWGYYGGNYQIGATSNAIANGTLTLTASTTNYIYADATSGAIASNTTGVPAGKIPLYSVVTSATQATSYTDLRSYQPSATASTSTGTVTSVALSAPTGMSVSGSPVTSSGTLSLSWANQTANYVFAGPTSGGAAAPTFRALVGADIPVMGASGSGHAAGGVPDPGSTAGATRFLREDATWAVPTGGGGGGSGTVTSVGATGGVETDQGSGAAISGSGNIRRNLIPTVVTSAHTFVTGDRGTAIITNSSSAVTQTLPTPTGSTGNYPNGWVCELMSIGSGTTTVAIPSGLTLDGVTNGTIALGQYQGCTVFTDGTNWFSKRGGSATKDPFGYYLANNPTTTGFTLTQNTNVAGNATMSNLSSGRGFNIIVPDQTSADNQVFCNQAVPGGSSFTVTTFLVPAVQAANACVYGIAFKDSTGKFVIFGYDGFAKAMEYVKWSDINTFGGRTQMVGTGAVVAGIAIWLRVQYTSGGNFIVSLSGDGETFVEQYRVSVTDYLGATLSQCGLWLNVNFGGTFTNTKMALSVMHYLAA